MIMAVGASNGTSKRTPVVKSRELKGALPTGTLDEGVDCSAVAASCVESLSNLKQEHLTDDAFWRDSLSLTGTQRTFFEARAIVAAWHEVLPSHRPRNFQVVPHSPHVFRVGTRPAWVTCMFTFETQGKQAGQCSGMLAIVPNGQDTYKIWSLSTLQEDLGEYGNPDDTPRSDVPLTIDGHEPLGCVVVGGGMSGVCVAGRLKALKVPTLVIERHPSIGDNWANRYDSVKLHLNKSYSEYPFQRIFDYQDYYLTRKDLVKGLRDFTAMHQLDVWTSTALQNASWDADSRSWSLRLDRNGQKETIRARHLVMAIGGGIDVPVFPDYDNRDAFQGIVMHSAQWKNSKGLKGKRAVVVGSANSAFDLAEDLVNGGLSSVTMVQRGRTSLLPSDHVRANQDPLYNPHMDIKLADRISSASPYPVGRQIIIAQQSALQAKEPGRWDKLRAAGFNFDHSPDIYAEVMERYGGQCLDMGGLSLIENGQVKVVSGNLPVSYTSKGLLLQDGTELETDIVLFGTGFRRSLRKSTAELVGDEIGDQLDDFWGLTAEGEVRGLAKPIGHPGIWYLGGGTLQARFTSRFLALQIKADLEGVPYEPYTDTP